MLGVRPHLGRLLTDDDSRTKNTSPVTVLQFDFWQNRFGGNRAIVGSTIRLNGYPFTVIGIAAPGFEGTDAGLPTNLWLPITMKPTLSPPWDELENERYAWFYLFGPLKARRHHREGAGRNQSALPAAASRRSLRASSSANSRK